MIKFVCFGGRERRALLLIWLDLGIDVCLCNHMRWSLNLYYNEWVHMFFDGGDGALELRCCDSEQWYHRITGDLP